MILHRFIYVLTNSEFYMWLTQSFIPSKKLCIHVYMYVYSSAMKITHVINISICYKYFFDPY